jgi:DHA1 family multidrug resistance protein-like MFS transporter
MSIANTCSIYSFVVYFGSSVYAPGIHQIVKQFGVSPIVASLGLALYVLACMWQFHRTQLFREYADILRDGIGPMIFSPLSELVHQYHAGRAIITTVIFRIPVLGRNSIYITTFTIFTALCIPEALTNSFSGLLVLRFLLGFFGMLPSVQQKTNN